MKNFPNGLRPEIIAQTFTFFQQTLIIVLSAKLFLTQDEISNSLFLLGSYHNLEFMVQN